MKQNVCANLIRMQSRAKRFIKVIFCFIRFKRNKRRERLLHNNESRSVKLMGKDLNFNAHSQFVGNIFLQSDQFLSNWNYRTRSNQTKWNIKPYETNERRKNSSTTHDELRVKKSSYTLRQRVKKCCFNCWDVDGLSHSRLWVPWLYFETRDKLQAFENFWDFD